MLGDILIVEWIELFNLLKVYLWCSSTCMVCFFVKYLYIQYLKIY